MAYQTYLCTTGTSAAKGARTHIDSHLSADWVKDQGGPEAAGRIIAGWFRDSSPHEEQNLIRELSAEIHSLARMPIDAKDRTVFFASDTPDGLACTYANKEYLEKWWPGITVEIVQIGGLQVHNAQAFQQEGVINFVKQCLRKIEAYGAAQCVLNPTGGFKALVPYTVLIGMLRNVRCTYIYERSTKLIDLPAIPVDVDHYRLRQVLPLMQECEQQSSIPKSRFDEAVHHNDRELLLSLFEEIGNELTLSAVGFLMFEQLQKPVQLEACVSKEARTSLNDWPHAEAFLLQCAHSPTFLKEKEHASLEGGLKWLKPGNTSDRYLVETREGRLLTWEIVKHDDYDRKGEQLAQQARERLGRYFPFIRLPLMSKDDLFPS